MLPDGIGKTFGRSGVSRFAIWVADHGDSVFVLTLYILITILFTWPLAANFATFVNGNVMDVFHELWYLNLDYHSAFGPFFILYTNSILYPFGVPMYFQVFSPLHAIIGAPVYYLFGLVPAYNFLYMFTFFASAFTMYILVKYLTKNGYAAFFAGLAFGFAPVHTAQGLAHLNIMAAEMLPLFGYFFVRMVRETRRRDAFYAGVTLAFNAMLDLHFLLFSGIIVVSFLVYYFLAQRRAILNKQYAGKLLIMFVVAGIIGVVTYYQTFYGLIFAPRALGTITSATVAVHLHRSPDLLQFFVPPTYNPILGKFSAPFYDTFLSFPQVETYIGYTVLGMALIGFMANRKKRDVLFWGVLAVVAFALSLGPNIEFNGQVTGLQGPWAYLYYLVPLFNSFRTPYRIDYVVALGMAVLAGYGITALTSAIGRRKSTKVGSGLKILVVALLTISLLVEFVPAPYPEMNATIPPFYTQVLANDHSNFAVLEVPAYSGNDVYLYYQSVYNEPLVNGHISRTPQSSLVFLQSAPFIDQLGQYIRGLSAVPSDIFNQTVSPTQVAPYILAQYNIKYIIIHKDLMPPKYVKKVVNLVSSALGVPYYEDNLTVVFRFTPPSAGFGLANYPVDQNVPYIGILNGGWNPYGLTYGLIGHHARMMESSAGLDFYMRSTQMMQLSFRAQGITGNHLLQVTVNGQTVGTYQVINETGPHSFQLFTAPFVQFQQGVNHIVFTSLDGCSAISYGAAQGATICASVGFSSVAVRPITASSA